jgi:hypothetical protein
MADSVPPSPRSAAIETQLLEAFGHRHAPASGPLRNSRSVFATLSARAWLAAAAVLVLAVAGWQGAVRWRSEPAATTVSAPDAIAPEVRVQAMAGSRAESDAPGLAAQPATPARAQPEPPAVPRESAWSAPRTRSGEVLQFVTLPTAIGLPALESGRIVRVELPTAMLPAYGLDVSPDSGAGMVEADVLVGQDGQPRAIRFVTLDSDPRRRQ